MRWEKRISPYKRFAFLWRRCSRCGDMIWFESMWRTPFWVCQVCMVKNRFTSVAQRRSYSEFYSPDYLNVQNNPNVGSEKG